MKTAMLLHASCAIVCGVVADGKILCGVSRPTQCELGHIHSNQSSTISQQANYDAQYIDMNMKQTHQQMVIDDDLPL